MSKKQKVATVLAAVGVLFVAGSKLINGELPSMGEVTLAVSALAAAFGFQFGSK